MTGTTIEIVTAPSDDDVRELAALLVDTVESGAGVSFMAGLPQDDAAAWWRKTFNTAPSRAIILVARDEEGIVGTVQLQPAWAPNQPHRADVAKLMVHQRARRHGIARALMKELERRARERRFTLLLLDTCKGYDAVFFYKELPAQS